MELERKERYLNDGFSKSKAAELLISLKTIENKQAGSSDFDPSNTLASIVAKKFNDICRKLKKAVENERRLGDNTIPFSIVKGGSVQVDNGDNIEEQVQIINKEEKPNGNKRKNEIDFKLLGYSQDSKGQIPEEED